MIDDAKPEDQDEPEQGAAPDSAAMGEETPASSEIASTDAVEPADVVSSVGEGEADPAPSDDDSSPSSEEAVVSEALESTEAASDQSEPEVVSEPEVAGEPVEERPSNLHWYTIRVQSNKEDTVRRALQNNIELRGLGRKITQVVVPTEKIAEIKRGKKRTRKVKTYPGYVLLEMVMDDETWSFVRETSGVGDFVGGSGGDHQKPFPLRPEEVAKIFGQDLPGEAEAPKVQLDFGMGDKVKITEGPFENFDGVVEEVNEQKGLIRVIVTIFGRATPVELQYWQVETI